MVVRSVSRSASQFEVDRVVDVIGTYESHGVRNGITKRQEERKRLGRRLDAPVARFS